MPPITLVTRVTRPTVYISGAFLPTAMTQDLSRPQAFPTADDVAPDDELEASSPVLRQVIAFTALISGLVALYLHLWKIGLMGPLSCTANRGCEIVQLSSWGWFLGIDVALIGTIGYTLIFIVAIVGTLPRHVDARWPTYALAALVYPAVLFTVRLKHAEFFIMHTFCPWCAISAVTITLHAILVALDWRRVRRVR